MLIIKGGKNCKKITCLDFGSDYIFVSDISTAVWSERRPRLGCVCEQCALVLWMGLSA